MTALFIIHHGQNGEGAFAAEIFNGGVPMRVFVCNDANKRALAVGPSARAYAHPFTGKRITPVSTDGNLTCDLAPVPEMNVYPVIMIGEAADPGRRNMLRFRKVLQPCV